VEPSNICKALKTLPNLSICIGSSVTAAPTVPASLHGEQDTRVGTIQVVVVEVLHHQKSAAVVLVCRVHDIVHLKSPIVKTCCKKICSKVIRNLIGVTAVYACKKSGWIAEILVEGAFASGLLLRTILVNNCCCLVYGNNVVSDLSLVLSLILGTQLFKSALTQKD